MNIKNRLFQMEWALTKPMIPRKSGNTGTLDDYSARFVSQISHASKYSPSLIIIGDSNGENLADIAPMEQIGDLTNRVCLNIAIGGTTADEWVQFFTQSTIGISVYRSIRNFEKIIFNIGGNNDLQMKMGTLSDSLTTLKNLFPQSFNCLIPPIHYGILEATGLWPEGYLERAVADANSYIKNIWGTHCIDTYTPFLDPATGEAYIIYDGSIVSITQDPVHFSAECDKKVRIPLISFMVKNIP